MRKYVAIFFVSTVIVAIALTGWAVAEEAKVPSPGDAATGAVADEGMPAIVFETTEHDFGKIGTDATVKHTFTFRNEGEAVLKIDNIKATCGCTGTLLSRDEIPPGEEGSIEVTYKSGQAGGSKTKAIYVQSNDPNQPNLRLTIMSEVIVPVEVKPRNVYWPIEKGKDSTQSVEVVHQPEIPLHIVSVETTSPAFTATYAPKEGDGLPGYDITIKCDGNLPIGSFYGKLKIMTDNPDYAKLEVLLRGDIRGLLRVVPRAVSLGVISDNVLPEGLVEVFTDDESEFEITGVESSSPLIETEVSRNETGKRYVIRVRLTSVPPRGAFSERILVSTNSKTENRIEIAVYGYVK